MDKAYSLAKDRDAHAFFYQMHTNGYQIVGIYKTADDMEGEWVWDDHKRGAIGSLDDIRDGPYVAPVCPEPAPFDGATDYGDSADNYLDYCTSMTDGDCAKAFCGSSYRNNCRNECDAKGL